MARHSTGSLVRHVQDGERQFWRPLGLKVQEIAGLILRRLNLDARSQSELCCDVESAAWEKIGQCKPSTFRGWVRAVSINKVKDYFRRRKRDPIAFGGSHAAFLESNPVACWASASRQEDSVVIAKLIAQVREHLTVGEWQVFDAVELSGKTTAEAAESLGMTAGAIRAAKGRVRKKLREVFGDKLTFDPFFRCEGGS